MNDRHAVTVMRLLMWCGWVCALAGCVGNRGGGPLVLRSPIARRDVAERHELSRLGEVDPLPEREFAEALTDGGAPERQGSSLLGLEKKAGVSNETWDAVLTELQTLAVVAPQEHARLVEDLRATDPSVWPTLLEYSRVALSRQRRGSIATDTPGPMRATTSRATAAAGPYRAQVANVEEETSLNERPPVGATIGGSGLPALDASVPAAVVVTTQAAPAVPSQAAGSVAVAPAVAATDATGLTTAARSAPAGAAGGSAVAMPASGAAAGEPQRLAADAGGAQPLSAAAGAGVNGTANSVVGTGGVQPAGYQIAAPIAASGSPVGALAGGVTAAAAEGTPHWQAQLEGAIRALEGQSDDGTGATKVAAQLPMLYLAAGRRDAALEKARGLESSQQAFWLSELYGLATYMDAARTPDAAARATEAATHLAQAQATLAESALLQVRNLAFCTRVDGFGVVKPFERLEFSPGQRVLLYAELDHFKSESTPEGFHTAFRCHYEIFDTEGRRVAQHQFELTEEHCRNRRRDFFICFDFHLPEQEIYEGRHTLKLTVEDTLANKVGQGSIDFEFHRAARP